MVVTRAVFVVGFITAGFLQSATTCSTGTLASYEALGAGGCYVGYLLVKDFSFSVLTSGGGALVLPDTSITITPTITGVGTFALGISSSGFSVSDAGFVKYLIGYTWDPRNIRSMDDVLVDPVTSPGLVKITTDGCVGAAFSGASCSGTIDTVIVSDDGVTPVTSDSVLFSPAVVSILGIRTTIDLEGGGSGKGGSASFMSVTNDAFTPEPATWLTTIVCLCALLVGQLSRSASGVHARQARMSVRGGAGDPPHA